VIFQLSDELCFPPVEYAEHDGLLAVGGDLSPDRLLLAYQQAIFPWFEGELPLWYSPDPRFVLLPDEVRISNSMKQVLRSGKFRFTVNKVFEEVIDQCSKIKREGQAGGTWITEKMKKAYVELHTLGYAHSAEAWHNGKLAGGLYGVRSGNVFCGESMFSRETNASKFAFIEFTRFMATNGIRLIDCQVYTRHLESLGAKMIPRKDYLTFLDHPPALDA
jgi:leucyl/phenylalanyl-tRNA--protein transferase